MNKILKFLRLIRTKEYLLALLLHRVAAGVEHSLLLYSLRTQDFRTIVDIGANRGQFALVAKTNFPKAKIISCEPLYEPATTFRHLFDSESSVTLHEVAIGPFEGESIIHVSHADDSSSLLPMEPLQWRLFPGTDEKEVRSIQIKPLDVVLQAKNIGAPALLKLDVQGYEKEALEGSKSLLNCFSFIYVECSFVKLYRGQSLAHEILSFLSKFGFHLSGIYNLSYDQKGIAIQGDFLFTRDKSE